MSSRCATASSSRSTNATSREIRLLVRSAGGAASFPAVAHPAEALPDEDDSEEDAPDHEHREDDVAAFLGRRLLGGDEDRCRERAHAARILLHPLGVKGEGPAARLVVSVAPPVKRRDSGGPGLAVARKAFGPEVGAEREKLGERPDGLHVAERGNAHEAVGIEVVAEEDPRVAVVRAKEARTAVVK